MRCVLLIMALLSGCTPVDGGSWGDDVLEPELCAPERAQPFSTTIECESDEECPLGSACATVDGGASSCAPLPFECAPGHSFTEGGCVPYVCGAAAGCERGAVCIDGCCQPDETSPMLFPFSLDVCAGDVVEHECRFGPRALGGQHVGCRCFSQEEPRQCDVGLLCIETTDDTGLGVCSAQPCWQWGDECPRGAVCQWELELCVPLGCSVDEDCPADSACFDGCCASVENEWVSIHDWPH